MTIPTSLVADCSLADLGPGAQLSMFGFRACAFGQAKCCCLIKTFTDVFGEKNGGQVLGRFIELAKQLGHDGNRKLKLAAPGCIRLTHDEASILGALSAAQHGDSIRRDSHLTWLLASSPRTEHQDTVDWIALALGGHNLFVTPPEIEVSQPAGTVDRPVLVVSAGHA